MKVLATWMLATAVSLTPMLGGDAPRRIDVDCRSDIDLQRVLDKVASLDEAEIVLRGVCKGNFIIASNGVTLRGATPDSGLAAPEGSSSLAVLEIVDAQVSLRGLSVQGGTVGVLVRGWNADVLLFDVVVHDQREVGVVAIRGPQVRLIDTKVQDALVGVLAQSSAEIYLRDVTVRDQNIGVLLEDKSFAGIQDTTIEKCREAGLNVGNRSDVNLIDGVFGENGQVHINANDRSSITLLSDVTLGSETDPTPFALGASGDSMISSFSTRMIHGNLGAVIGASIQLGNTVLDGDLLLVQFSNAFVRDAQITGIVVCVDGANAICNQTTTGGAIDCPSPTCGSAPAEAAGRPHALSGYPAVEVPRFEWLQPSGRPRP